MGKRKFGDRSPAGVDLAGDLKSSLYRHARERANHFFYYLFLMRVLVNRLNAVAPHLRLGGADGVSVTATDQIDTGFRRGKWTEYRAFDDTDTGVVTQNSSDFGSMDAAHFCNLGIDPGFLARTSTAAASDPIASDCLRFLERVCGNTQQLPQRVNIGPDRVIDVMHGDLALDMLRVATPKVVSLANVHTYRTTAILRMEEYQRNALGNGDDGIAACAGCYLDVYRDVGIPTRDQRRRVHINYRRTIAALPPGQDPPPAPAAPALPFIDGVFRAIESEARGACASSNGLLKIEDYLS